MVEFTDSRIALYNGKQAISVAQQSSDEGEADDKNTLKGTNPVELYLQRQPALRVQWKPDIQRLGSESGPQLAQYLDEFFQEQHPDVRDDESLAVIGGLLQLAGHKNPRMRVLEVGGDAQGYKAKLWQSMLGKQTAFSQVRSWHVGTVHADTQEVLVQDDVEAPFDVLLVPRVSQYPSSISLPWLSVTDNTTHGTACNCGDQVPLDVDWRKQYRQSGF